MDVFSEAKLHDLQSEVIKAIYNWQWPSILLAFSICYTAYYMLVVVKKPRFVCGKGLLSNRLKKHLYVIQERYWPTFWCFSAHMMTVCRVIFKSKPFIPYRRELLETPDGGLISLDWVDNDQGNLHYPDPATRPTLFIMPGLTGCSETSYCRHLVLAAKEMGMRALVMNNRGFGRDILLQTPRTFAGNNTDDLQHVLDHLRALLPDSKVFGVGISLGGCIMSHWLAEVGDTQSQMVGAFIVSVPWNCFHSTTSLERPLNWFLFNRHLTQKLLTMLKRNLHVFEQHLSSLPYELDHVFQAKSIREFDDRFTSKTFGYKDYVDYYNAASLDSAPLGNIAIPTLFLNSEDDPFSPGDSIPVDVIRENPSLALILTKYGGHIGFTDGLLIRSMSIVENSFMQFAKAMLDTQVTQAT
ncbi:phospholipase ABHD3-like [Rhopilema esculentum]|uniref:phospholipase ABHD3-like n=1 Tax=Rhopilema esculentum TaxID=499914 RepID=UPI0031D74A7A